MKYLVYSSCSNAYPHFGVQIDEAEKLFREGHDVTFAYCEGVVDTCFKNMNANPALCQLCQFGYSQTLKKLSKGIEIIPMKNRDIEKGPAFNYSTVEDIKKLIYKEVYIGYAILSTYISLTRNPSPEITNESRVYFNHLLEQACKLTDSIYEIIAKNKPDVICVYNGRFLESRPFYDIALSLKIKIICNEVIGGSGGKDPFRIVFFENSMPHLPKTFSNRIIDLWNDSKFTDEEKIQIGESFYKNRKEGVPSGDKVFIKHQEKGKLPLNWDNNKKNIVIFNSSEDEFAAVGKDFEKYLLFDSQLEGIKYILSTVENNNYHFYLRIHPNLSSVNYSYHTDLLELEQSYDNITVIKATDSISTYSLMDAADKVVVFGSTTGIEATYWGKPSILLAGAMYYYINACYIPKTKEEVTELIISDLPVKDNFPAIQYGYYIMDREFLSTKSIYFDLDTKNYSVFGFKCRQPKYMTLFGSKAFMKIINLIGAKIIPRFFKNKIKTPDMIFEDNL
jgi:hypothetical protein